MYFQGSLVHMLDLCSQVLVYASELKTLGSTTAAVVATSSAVGRVGDGRRNELKAKARMVRRNRLSFFNSKDGCELRLFIPLIKLLLPGARFAFRCVRISTRERVPTNTAFVMLLYARGHHLELPRLSGACGSLQLISFQGNSRIL